MVQEECASGHCWHFRYLTEEPEDSPREELYRARICCNCGKADKIKIIKWRTKHGPYAPG